MKSITRGLMLVLSVLLVFPWVAQGSTVHGHEPSTDAIAAEVLVYINQYRASHGLPKLVMNEAANREARRHSQEMANHAMPFGHGGFNQRMKHIYHSIADADGGAENVAYNYKTARIVVDGWIKSPGHQRNIVGRYNMTGIGIVRDGAGKLYYTQLFVRTQKHEHPSKNAHARGHSRTRFFIG